MNSVSMAPSTTIWATWMPRGPSSRAMLWASARTECGHLPDLHVLAPGLIQDAAGHVGADVEHHDFDGASLLFDLVDEGDHIFLFARIAAVAERLATGRADALDRWFQLVGRAPRQASDVALAGEARADRATSCVARADDEGHTAVVG